MYRTEIVFRDDVPQQIAIKMKEVACNAFDNRAGMVPNTSTKVTCLVFEGNESKYACLELGVLALKRTPGFIECVAAWSWEDDEDPAECCDMLEVFATPVR